MSDATGTIQLAHGGGGRLTRELIEQEIVPRFGAGPLRGLPDAASLPPSSARIIFTTDGFVVQPLEFPGGDIGDLAVYGTVNDISVSGGVPKWLSLGLILEEGLEIAMLRRILDSVKRAADSCGVVVATGDTKVVAHGQCDGLYINTAGIGEALPEFVLGVDRISPGDAVLVSGPLADHGMAVVSARQNIAIVNGPRSDTGPLHRLVNSMRPLGTAVRFMRDPTRGGAASVLNEIVEGRPFGAILDETAIPLSDGTRAAAEMLGLDPLHVPSEGRVIAICANDAVDEVLAGWRALPEGAGCARIGTITSRDAGRVIIDTLAGGRRVVDVPRGELLPRIC
ncbi:MAG: hydrogenase expression/formation protein HypE [Verrucomicrobia bacterium]|nr:hydrogenase expression/formation protein HypE [Verrucomicrobiota bacterium]